MAKRVITFPVFVYEGNTFIVPGTGTGNVAGPNDVTPAERQGYIDRVQELTGAVSTATVDYETPENDDDGIIIPEGGLGDILRADGSFAGGSFSIFDLFDETALQVIVTAGPVFDKARQEDEASELADD